MYYKMTKTLTKTKVIRISETQHQTLVKKMKSYNFSKRTPSTLGALVEVFLTKKIF